MAAVRPSLTSRLVNGTSAGLVECDLFTFFAGFGLRGERKLSAEPGGAGGDAGLELTTVETTGGSNAAGETP